MSSGIEEQQGFEEKHDEEVVQFELEDDQGVEELWKSESEINKHVNRISSRGHQASVSTGPGRKKTSSMWNKFTIVDQEAYIAKCNICEVRLSFRTTVSNLKKHLKRKHSYDCEKRSYEPGLYKQNTRKGYHTVSSRILEKSTLKKRKHSLADLGGLDNVVIRVLGAEGEEIDVVTPQEHEEVQEEIEYITGDIQEVTTDHSSVPKLSDHSTYTHKQRSHAGNNTPVRNYTPYHTTITDKNERVKRNRIMDLQLECLEIQKYNMQMEALLMEQQLNLPRSVYTERLRGADTFTRSTQTDVGGGSTKVFYVSDSATGEGRRHLFAFQQVD